MVGRGVSYTHATRTQLTQTHTDRDRHSLTHTQTLTHKRHSPRISTGSRPSISNSLTRNPTSIHTSFIENSIQAGILLCRNLNGIFHAKLVARTYARTHLCRCHYHCISYFPFPLTSLIISLPYRACSAVVISLRFGTQDPGFEPGLFHKACYIALYGC